MRQCAVLLLLLLLSVSGVGSGTGQESDRLREAHADPMELARAVRALGDDAVLVRVADGSVGERVAALRATAYLESPERALSALAELAGSDDADLAPVAALAAWRIARALDPRALDDRESDPSELLPARDSFAALGADGSARLDIAALARMTADALDALVRAPTSE